MTEIRFFNRSSGKVESEKIYSENAMRFLYENPLGYYLAQKFLVKPWFSRLYGWNFSRPGSLKKIPGFVAEHSIAVDQYEDRYYSSFNDFFTRKFKEGARAFIEEEDKVSAVCEGKVLAFAELDQESDLPVKNQLWKAKDLAKLQFEPGPVLIFRLAPADYHRFHFPDDGTLISRSFIEGRLDSVNPLSLRQNRDVFLRNRRVCYHLQTKNFGRMTCVAVAGLCVGQINDSSSERFTRGQEMGYFEFGGSTLIIFGEKDKWSPSPDLLANTRKGLETFVRLGETVGYKN